MTQTGKRTATIPMRSEKGMWAINSSAPGDAAEVPDGYALLLHNYLTRPLRQIRRPPFVYDSLMSVANLLRWEDMANQVTKTLAVDASQNLRTKDSTGLGYTAAVVTGTPSGRLTDFANFMGKVYQMFDDGAGTPAGASVYDGSSVSSSPFNTAITARTITSFIERLFLACPRVTVNNLLGTTKAYRATAGNWTLGNVDADDVVAGGTTTGRLTPTDATTAFAYADAETLVGQASVTKRVYRCDLQAVSASYDMPVTIAVRLAATWNVGDAVSSGGLITPSARNGFVYRAQNAGTTGGAEPTWATTLGSTVTDNGITWICYQSDTLGFVETSIFNSTAIPSWQPVYVSADLPPDPDTYVVRTWIIFGNSATPTYTLAPLNFAYRDGLADGNPAKQNHGQQYTAGDFYPPFFNQEASATATVNLDAVVWSEIQEPKRILAKNTFTLPEVAGLPIAACQVAGRYVVFKRRGFWVFKRTTDKNVPILPEKPANTEIGCIGPRAWDTFGAGQTTDFRKAQGDTLYWIGENGIYRMGDDWNPEEIGGPAMREEIMARGAGWVESQATYNIPFLVVEHANREVWVYTQAGKIYVYHILSGAWSYIDVSGAPPVRSMLYDFVGGRMLVSFGGFGVTRLMETSTAKDTIDNTATPLTVTADVIYKPLELYAPRYEAYLEEVGVFHLATASQTGQTVTPSYSYDRGTTFTTPAGYPATISLSTPRVRLPIGAMGPSVTVKISAAGGGGQTNWSISKADATLQVKRGELPWVNATTA